MGPANALVKRSDDRPILIGIRVAPRRLVGVLAVGAGVVSALGLLGQWLHYRLGITHSFGFIGQFDPDGEGNFSTWYSSTLLLAAAGLFATVGRYTARAGQAYAAHWRIMAVLLLLMSIDETAQVHEMLIAPLRTALGGHGIFYFTWVIPAGALALGVLLWSLRFLASLPVKTRGLMILGAGVYLSGAIGMEMVDGWYASRFGELSLQYAAMTALEEGLEMAGTLLLACCATAHLAYLAAASALTNEGEELLSTPSPATEFRGTAASENTKGKFRRQHVYTSGR